MPSEKTLASYRPWLRDADDEWRLRIVLHDFGFVWQQTDKRERLSLVAEEPETLGAHWDAFLAAWVDLLGVATPDQVFDVVDSAYPDEAVPERGRIAVEALFEHGTELGQ